MARTKRREIHDRCKSTLRPRRELLEALFNFAVHKTDRRRRRARAPRVPLLRVALWCELGQDALLAAYRRHARYLKDERGMTKRTLTRQVAGFRRMRLVEVINPSHYDRRTGRWIHRHNVYTFTRAGVLWIKRHARAVRIPSVI